MTWLLPTIERELDLGFFFAAFVVHGDDDNPQKVLFKDMVADLGAKLLGDELWDKYGGWPIYSILLT